MRISIPALAFLAALSTPSFSLADDLQLPSTFPFLDYEAQLYGGLVTQVTVANKTGHRMPSGMGFRRAFLEVRTIGADGETLWCSGCTNGVGVIVDGEGVPLDTEFLDVVPPGATEALYQPHRQVITKSSQVQIYEELTQNAQRVFTTSFVQRVFHPKRQPPDAVGHSDARHRRIGPGSRPIVIAATPPPLATRKPRPSSPSRCPRARWIRATT